MIRIKIEKLVEGGQGIGYSKDPTYVGQTFFVWNALPEEEVDAEIVNKKNGIYEARVINIIKPSPHRIDPIEDHFLSCSPWQTMDFEYENETKKNIATETYKRIGGIDVGDIQIFSDNKQFDYRNKMEFSFMEIEGKISLAFFQRGQKKRIAINGCELANPAINKTARDILEWINQNQLTERNLKALIIRSNKKGETIAGLFIKDKMTFKKYPDPDGDFLGFNLYYSTHKSPASVITEILYQKGQDSLTEEISVENSHGCSLRYGINSFFQVNIPVFEIALRDISGFINNNNDVIDFYSGVGSIGLNIDAKQLIESNEEAVNFAQENIEINKKNCEAILAPAEKALEYIVKDSVIVFDPPRAGLHQKVVDRILEIEPQKIVYLSCNIATQSRDIGLLKEVYDIKFIKLYNFFPHTPHIEGLCILELK